MNDTDPSDSHSVELYIYDLTQGMARMMSQMMLGRQLDGVWHTSVVIYGREIFFGSSGIQSCIPGGTVLGQPLKKEKIGETFIPYSVFKDYLRGLAEGNFRGSEYSLLQNNCNTFSEDLCQFLCGTSIPKYILDLPQEFLSTPLGQSLGPLIDRIGSGAGNDNQFVLDPQIGVREQSPGFEDLNDQIEAARAQSQALDEKRQSIQDKIAKKEKKKEKRKKRDSTSSSGGGTTNGYSTNGFYNQENTSTNATAIMSDTELSNLQENMHDIPAEMLPTERALKDDAEERKAEEERRRNRDPPIVYIDIDAKAELEALVKLVDGQLSKEEETAIEELHQYLIEGEGSWALGDNFLTFVGRILQDANISTETRVHLLRALAYAALKDDIILLLHQDRRDHVLMNFALEIEKRAPEEQQALALFMCNLFENVSSSEWLLYISEWTLNNQPTSNIRATTKVAVHCLLATCPTLQDVGTGIINNLACKEVFDDVVVELSMALLQYFQTKPAEEHLFRTIKALGKFMPVSSDIPLLIRMMGPDLSKFKGVSDRIDALVEPILKKLPKE